MFKEDERYKTTIVGNNINHYRKYYPNVKIGEVILVKPEELPPQSHLKVKFICDFCGQVYERILYSEMRSGACNACKNCRQKKIEQTCLEKYGVRHPMQDAVIHEKSVNNHINNFGKAWNSCGFINGIPVSKVQKQLGEAFPEFIVNYKEAGYFYDLFNKELNLVIEYNGKGHDLQVRRGKISLEEFQKKEILRKEVILKTHNLLIIEDPLDRLVHPNRFQTALIDISQAISDLKKYNVIQIV